MVKVTLEPGEFKSMPAENCAFCYHPTRYWHTKKDVPVCPGCAKKVKAADIPAKKDWCADIDSKMDTTPWGAQSFPKDRMRPAGCGLDYPREDRVGAAA